jgi:hypothetical protein
MALPATEGRMRGEISARRLGCRYFRVDLAFQRLMSIVDHWLLTGEWQGDEFAARRIGRFSCRTVTIALYTTLALFVLACVVLALT